MIKFTRIIQIGILYGSETSSSLRSRGEYGHPDEQKVLDTTNFEHKKYQMSSYDNDRVSWEEQLKTLG